MLHYSEKGARSDFGSFVASGVPWGLKQRGFEFLQAI